ncbi:MAG: OOP family porin [Rhodobacteraceae bacterium HLUCCA12]|nr:MAG: OOP family porin [Rhodobacteraceae bacterium HLUCCA12]
MQRPSKLTLATLAAFVVAALLSAVFAVAAAGVIERTNRQDLDAALRAEGLDWVAVSIDGLQVQLSGTAPDEAARIRALQVAGRVVDASRVSQSFDVRRASVDVAPDFRIEAMRNNDDLSVIGLVPADPGEASLVARLAELSEEAAVSDMLQSAEHPAPAGWQSVLDFVVDALGMMPVAQVSASAERIEVHALVASAEARDELQARLQERAPADAELLLDLVAPRPVIAPFTLRFVIDEEGARFDACAAGSEDARARILRAARAAGAGPALDCTIALGSPSTRWAEAVELAIGELAELDAGVVTFSDGDLSLVVPADVSQSAFDRAVGRLETRLPDAFELTAVQVEPDDSEETPDDSRPEVLATLSSEGTVLIAGRLPDARIRDSVSAFARARFGSDAVTVETRTDPDLPSGWSVRVLTALEALAELHEGRVRVREDRMALSGVSGNPEANAQVSGILAEGLGQGAVYSVNVRYDAALDPVEQEPTPERCEARVQDILAENRITFPPGSSMPDDSAGSILDEIADVLRECGTLEMEVSGHTDSQGRAEANLALSQARAEAVINALMARRVLVSGMVARGYGSEQPVADNDTEAGREDNRRIEMALIRPEPDPLQRDPELEAQLVFDIQEPDDDTTRPRARPGGIDPPPTEDDAEAGSDDADRETEGDTQADAPETDESGADAEGGATGTQVEADLLAEPAEDTVDAQGGGTTATDASAGDPRDSGDSGDAVSGDGDESVPAPDEEGLEIRVNDPEGPDVRPLPRPDELAPAGADGQDAGEETQE